MRSVLYYHQPSKAKEIYFLGGVYFWQIFLVELTYRPYKDDFGVICIDALVFVGLYQCK